MKVRVGPMAPLSSQKLMLSLYQGVTRYFLGGKALTGAHTVVRRLNPIKHLKEIMNQKYLICFP